MSSLLARFSRVTKQQAFPAQGLLSRAVRALCYKQSEVAEKREDFDTTSSAQNRIAEVLRRLGSSMQTSIVVRKEDVASKVTTVGLSEVPVSKKGHKHPLFFTGATMDGCEIKHPLKDLAAQIKLNGDEANSSDVTGFMKGLKTELMPHQVEAVTWMAEREKASNGPSGGILADDMGLGKTLTSIAHILASLYAERGGSGSKRSTRKGKPTLVVAPPALIHQWADEVKKHVHDEELTVMVYYGPNRLKDAHRFKANDIVVTTYNVLQTELFALKEAPLHTTEWRRVLLDEGHTIKNHETKTARAAYALQAEARWIATGTPVQNTTKELYSFFRFLRFAPYDDINVWEWRMEGRRGRGELKRGTQPILLLRTKDQKNDNGQHILDLEPKIFIHPQIDLSGPQREIYTTIRVCCHPSLLREDIKLDLCRSLTQTDLDIDRGILAAVREVGGMASFDRGQSGSKLACMLEVLKNIPEDEKGVVVCEWMGMLDVVGHHAQKLGITCTRIDGTMKPLEKNNRVHRKGQTRQVYVHHFLCTGTVEETLVLEVQKLKRKLHEDLLGDSGQRYAQKPLTSLSKKQLQAILSK